MKTNPRPADKDEIIGMLQVCYPIFTLSEGMKDLKEGIGKVCQIN